jgi:hypothetical protein
MSSTYTTANGIELINTGEQSGAWGDTTNTNLQIVDRVLTGIGSITLSGTAHTLTTTYGALSEGMYRVLVLGGSPSGTNTITVAPDDAQKTYMVYNNSGESAIFTQGSGANVTVANGDAKLIYMDGAGSGAAVFDFTANLAMSSVNITGGVVNGVSSTGIDFTGDATFGDSDKAIFGAGSDLQIYHDGSHSVIKEAGTGNLQFYADTRYQFFNADGSASYAQFIGDGGAGTEYVQLRFGNLPVLETTSTGIDVTGTITSDGLTVDGDITIAQSAGGTFLKFDVDGTIDEALIGMDSTDLIISVDPTNVRASSDFVIKNDGTETFRIDSSGNVGIGTDSPSELLHISSGGAPAIRLQDTTNSNTYALIDTGNNGQLRLKADVGQGIADSFISFEVDAAEAMRITSARDVLIGTTDNNVSNGSSGQGISLSAGTFGGYIAVARNSNCPLSLNRLSNDGDIAQFRQDGSVSGRVGVLNGDIFIGKDSTNLLFKNGNDGIYPRGTDGAVRDNAIDLGSSGNRFTDIYASNAAIQTSDRNEKQDIASLTPTEMLVAARLSTGFKNFKWKDQVAEKGDNARLHSGAIAQNVQDAFTAEGLDAGNYAMFISSTWWEHDVDVPAVDAVEGVDGVQAVEAVDYAEAVEATCDEDGIELTAYVPEVQAVEAVVGVEYVEAVEAKDAYTRTDTYDTLEEAPEGATERTRLGIRYPELLSFVAAYNEQRFASIETRLTALEA